MSDLDDPYDAGPNEYNQPNTTHFLQSKSQPGLNNIDHCTDGQAVDGGIFLQPNSYFSPDDVYDAEPGSDDFGYNVATDFITPTSTRPPSPQNSAPYYVPYVGFARSRSGSVSSEDSGTSSMSLTIPNSRPAIFASEPLGSDPDDTPPLTPDSFSAISLTWSIHSQLQGLYPPELDDDDYHLDCLTRPSAIKEGKKPERPICYDALIDDISPFTADYDYDESNEWYGLEYTLELSSRDRRAAEIFTSIGEHSKSRESWAAMHLGTIDPYYEEEEFFHWRRWHYFLEVQEQRRKERRTHEFLAQSFDFSWLFVEEMRATEMYHWQKQYYGKASGEIAERLELIAEYRPDPYLPAQNHNLGWVLKRSRSVSCLQELRRDG